MGRKMLVLLAPIERPFPLMTFKVGETVVYPHHGAAQIQAIEKRIIKGEEKVYLVLKVAQGDLTVRVPAENIDLVGVRDVVDSAGLDRVFNATFTGFYDLKIAGRIDPLAKGIT